MNSNWPFSKGTEIRACRLFVRLSSGVCLIIFWNKTLEITWTKKRKSPVLSGRGKTVPSPQYLQGQEWLSTWQKNHYKSPGHFPETCVSEHTIAALYSPLMQWPKIPIMSGKQWNILSWYVLVLTQSLRVFHAYFSLSGNSPSPAGGEKLMEALAYCKHIEELL